MKQKRALTSRRWLLLFVLTLLALSSALPLFNYITDPFGAFGDRFFQWWSYDATMNPRVAKISYLEQNHEKYDSYIIGNSSTSSYPAEELNKYFGADFYNLIMYGADMLDVERTCRYLAENCTVKNLVLNVHISNGLNYDVETDPLNNAMHYKAEGGPALPYFKKYLFANPLYGWTKIKKRLGDSYLQQSHDVFNEETGAYDKSRRDIEGIGGLSAYIALDSYAVFADYPKGESYISCTEQTMESVARIKALCGERGINLLVLYAPVYGEYLANFRREQVEDFITRLAQVTDFWDFSLSSVSFEPRYFYDYAHFRNCVGKMALARVFGDGSVYVPEDFGVYVTSDNVSQRLADYWNASALPAQDYSANIPILLYHHLTENGGENAVSAAAFEAQIAALAGAGYTGVSFEELYRYVNYGEALPEKPVAVTFDDGYYSNYGTAFPILKKYNMKATIFIIGVSDGKNTYKDSGKSIIPHFSITQAKEMEASGLVFIESHGYDIHEVPGLDPEPVRHGILQKENESEGGYIGFLRRDIANINDLFLSGLGKTAGVLAYPYGAHSTLAEVVLNEYSFYATVTSDPMINTVIKGLPQSLYCMGRYTVEEDISPEELIGMIQNSKQVTGNK